MSRSSTAAHATAEPGRAPARRRGRRVRLAIGLGAVALVAAACLPLPPPLPTPASQYCGPATATTTPGYQNVFLAMRRTYTEWVSGDGAIPVDLPDGRRVFLFSDSYVGTTTTADGIDASDRLVHNTFVVQDGPCFTPLMGGVPHARTALIPDPAPNEWYWPASGVVENGSKLRVIVWHMQVGNGGPLNFVALDMRVATFALPSLTLESVQPLPIPTSGDRPYGATILAAPDGYLYLYGRDNNRDQFVARVQRGQLVSGPYQVWGESQGSGPQWQSDPTLAVPLVVNNVPPLLPQLGTGTGPAAELWVAPYQGGYLATAKPADIFSDTVSVFTALHPEGPWTWREDVAVTPPSAASGLSGASDLVAYGAFTLTPSTSPIVVYSTNTSPFASNPPPRTIDNYGPQFASPSAPLPTIP
jgi:hypothetical protein